MEAAVLDTYSPTCDVASPAYAASTDTVCPTAHAKSLDMPASQITLALDYTTPSPAAVMQTPPATAMKIDSLAMVTAAPPVQKVAGFKDCLLYTSDAADE